MLTKYVWTVYMSGRIFDIMTDEEVEEVMSLWAVRSIDRVRCVIEFV